MEKISQKQQEFINEIEVFQAEISIPETCRNATRLCDPECMFEMIEECKICGRCI